MDVAVHYANMLSAIENGRHPNDVLKDYGMPRILHSLAISARCRDSSLQGLDDEATLRLCVEKSGSDIIPALIHDRLDRIFRFWDDGIIGI